MLKNWININKNIRIFCKCVNITDNKCVVLGEMRDQNNVAYRLNVPRSKIKGKNFQTYLANQLLNYNIQLTQQDIKKIEQIISNALNEPAENYNGKLSLERLLAEMYWVACGLTVWFESSMCVDNDCLYIKATTKSLLQYTLNDFDTEWKQLEFKQQLKLHDLLITDKHQPYVYSVYSLGNAKVKKGEPPHKYLKIPLVKMKEFCKDMGMEISDMANDTGKEVVA